MAFCPQCFGSDRRVPYNKSGVCYRCAPAPVPALALWFNPPPRVSDWIAALKSAPEETVTDAQAELCVLDTLGWVPDELALTAAAAEALYDSARSSQPPPGPEPAGSFYGTEGRRYQQQNAHCTHVSSLGARDPKYGESWLVKFVTPCGCELTWFASSDKWLPEPDRSYDIKFTVKDHEIYKGRRQTRVQRVGTL
jgi:hypothetical protein